MRLHEEHDLSISGEEINWYEINWYVTVAVTCTLAGSHRLFSTSPQPAAPHCVPNPLLPANLLRLVLCICLITRERVSRLASKLKHDDYRGKKK